MDDVIRFQATRNGDHVWAEWRTDQYRTDITDSDRWCAQVLEDFLDCSGLNKERVLAFLLDNRSPYTGNPEDPFR